MSSTQNVVVGRPTPRLKPLAQRSERPGGSPMRAHVRPAVAGDAHRADGCGHRADGCGHRWLPAPEPAMVRAAREYLAPRFAVGVDGFLWESMQQPLPDLDAIDAVVAASNRAVTETGPPSGPLELAAALVLLGAARLDMDQTEARLLNAARASAMGWEQIAAIMDLSVEEAEERYRRLKPRLDERVADVLPPRFTHRPAHRPRAAHRASRSANGARPGTPVTSPNSTR